MSSLLREEMQRVLFRPEKQKLVEFIEIEEEKSGRHFLCVSVFAVYKQIASCDIEDSICSEFTGNLEALLIAVVKCVKSVPGYFAYTLRDSMRRAGTDDETLIRIMVSRSEEDMLDIRAQFKKMYGESLHRAIQDDTDGDYGKALLYLCGGDD